MMKIEKVIELVAEELNKERLVIFIGAGCSVSAGLPSWDKLINNLLEKYNTKTKETNLLRLANTLEREPGALKFREDIVEELRIRPDVKSALHDTLTSLDVNLFITTNYDHLLEDSFRNYGYTPQIVLEGKDLPSIDTTKKTIVKLHGDINSPTSLVITSRDYTKYKSKHRSFVEWLNSIVSQNTVLFLGTSFDDPRLREMDDHVLNLFGEFRRKPFIFLKTPKQDVTTSKDDYEVELQDYEELCNDFKERDFFVITISEYDEIVNIIQNIHNKALTRKIQDRPSDLKSKLSLQSDYSESLEKKLSNLLDKETLKLCKWVMGGGQIPTPALRIKRAEDLINHLENPPHQLLPESQLEGWITVIDALLSADKKDRILQSRQCYDKANQAFQKVSEPSKWEDRLIRIRTKLLFFEGKKDEAIETISKMTDNKGIALWLAILFDYKRFNEAYDFVTTREIHPYWIREALYVLIHTGRVQQAEDLFRKTIDEYEATKNSGNLNESPFENIFFYEKICCAMADSLFQRAIRLTGEKDFQRILPGCLTKEGQRLCEKVLEFIDRLLQQASRQNLGENYFAFIAVHIEMSVAYLLKKWEQADQSVRDLATVSPVTKEVVTYIVNRSNLFDPKFIEKIIEYLSYDYKDQQSWAYEMISKLELLVLKDYKKSWINAKKSIELAVSIKEKEIAARWIFELSDQIKRLDEATALIKETLPSGNLWNKILQVRYFKSNGNKAAVDKVLKEIDNQNLPNDIAAEIKLIRADYAIKEENWEEARNALEDSYKLALSPLALKELLYVLTKLQDNEQAMKVAEQIESLGIVDWQVKYIIAQTTRNLGKYKKSEEVWRELYKHDTDNSQYAYGLAEILIIQNVIGNKDNALNILLPFIKDEKNFNLNCLALACDIYRANENDRKAFDLLESNFDKIKDTPSLLLKHMELGYQTDNEINVNKSILRLKILKQEGKVPEREFSEISIDEVKELITERYESQEKIKDLYRFGKIPRLYMCHHFNIPLYLDWAVKTQVLKHPPEQKQLIDFVTYSTNGMRVQLNKWGKNQLVPIVVPEKTEEIIIDYNALITVHRLDLFKKLCKRFSIIYYPHVLRNIWITERSLFSHHQLSREKTHKTLYERLQSGDIKDTLTPDPINRAEITNDNIIKRRLSLSISEGIPLVDAYIKKEDLVNFSKVYIVRLTQLVDWLYQKGRLSEKQWQEKKNIARDEHQIYENKDLEVKLEETYRIQAEETTLELMEQNGLVQILIDMGVQIFVERCTANYIKNNINTLDFKMKVNNWHKDLESFVNEDDSFMESESIFSNDEGKNVKNLYGEAVFSTIKMATEKKLPILTDDRCIQMIHIPQILDKQFGTDALLNDLYKNEIIGIDEYANAFLKLCQWRYYFLLPHVDILVSFAHQYKNKIPGKPLEVISNYGQECMDDQGLFLGLEQTDPPMPLGYKFWQEWLIRWTRLLVIISQDKSFEEEKQKEITKWVLMYAMPDSPKGLKPEIRRNFAQVKEKAIFMELFLSAITVKDSLQFHGLFEHIFALIPLAKDKMVSELKEFLISVNDKDEHIDRENIKTIARKLLLAYYGDKGSIDPSLIPVLDDIGLKLNEGKKKLSEIGYTDIEQEDTKKLIELISKRDQFRENISEFVPSGPLILTPISKNKEREALIPHDLIQHPSRDLRIETFKDILTSPYVSEFTKQLVQEKVDAISSGDRTVWHPASGEISNALMKDFLYAHSLFNQIQHIPLEDDKLLNEAWKGTLCPDLETVLNELPIILQKPLEQTAIIHRVEDEIRKLPELKKVLGIKEILDWYLKEIFFIPVSFPLNPWEIIKHAISICKLEDYVSRSTDVLNTIKEWVNANEDPLAYLMALEIILNIRFEAKGDEKEVFSNEDFYRFLDNLLEVLLLEITVDESILSNPLNKKIHAAWNMRRKLAKYYLQYIDLNASSELEDEKRVAVACWMAREVVSSITNFVSVIYPSLNDQILWLQGKAQGVISTHTNHIMITHLFEDHRKCLSIGRYYTLDNKETLPTTTLSVATLSMLMPQKDKLLANNKAFDGLKEPATALSPNFRDSIIQTLYVHTLSGKGQFPKKDSSVLPLLWNTSLCVSAPAFLRAYYEDAFNLIGKDSVHIIEIAELASQPDFLEKELVSLQQKLKDKDGYSSALILASLEVYFTCHDKLPAQFLKLKENRDLINEICRLDHHWGNLCLVSFISILTRLQFFGDSKSATEFKQFFIQIDYDKLSDDKLNIIVRELISIVLLGYEYSILQPIFDKITSDKRIRRILGETKLSLEYTFPRVPPINRERLKRILTDLSDVSTPEKPL